MACPQVEHGEDSLQIWRVAENILNKHIRTTDKGWYSSWAVGRGVKKLLTVKDKFVMKCHKGLGTGLILWLIDLC
jgi:hypothetical protein